MSMSREAQIEKKLNDLIQTLNARTEQPVANSKVASMKDAAEQGMIGNELNLIQKQLQEDTDLKDPENLRRLLQEAISLLIKFKEKTKMQTSDISSSSNMTFGKIKEEKEVPEDFLTVTPEIKKAIENAKPNTHFEKLIFELKSKSQAKDNYTFLNEALTILCNEVAVYIKLSNTYATNTKWKDNPIKRNINVEQGNELLKLYFKMRDENKSPAERVIAASNIQPTIEIGKHRMQTEGNVADITKREIGGTIKGLFGKPSAIAIFLANEAHKNALNDITNLLATKFPIPDNKRSRMSQG